MKATVLGAGSWGTALAFQLCRAGNQVVLWDRKPKRAEQMNRDRVNAQYLPDFEFPEALTVVSDLQTALADTDLVVVVAPSQTVRSIVLNALPFLSPETPLCCASKGIEQVKTSAVVPPNKAVLKSSDDSDGIRIKSPIIGTAYLAPEPGAKKFVEVGDKIKKGQTVMIVEAMKTMNHVPSTANGEVKKILIEDSQPVEFGQTLVILK